MYLGQFRIEDGCKSQSGQKRMQKDHTCMKSLSEFGGACKHSKWPSTHKNMTAIPDCRSRTEEEEERGRHLAQSLLILQRSLGQLLPLALHLQPQDVLPADLQQLLRLCTTRSKALGINTYNITLTCLSATHTARLSESTLTTSH